MIFINFEVISCKDLLYVAFEILHSCLYVLELLEYKQLA